MGTVFTLTVRQLATRARILVLSVLGLLPVWITWLMTSDATAPSVAEFETIVLGGMMAASIVPLIVLSIASVSLGHELSDRTLANLVLTPLPRWKIVAAKVGASAVVAAPFVLGSAAWTSWLAFNHDVTALVAVVLATLGALFMYAALFTWLGLAVSQGIGVGLLYIVLWEGLFSGYVTGIRFLSVRHYAAAIMNGLDPRRFADAPHVSLAVAATVAVVVVALFGWRTTARLSRMDVP